MVPDAASDYLLDLKFGEMSMQIGRSASGPKPVTSARPSSWLNAYPQRIAHNGVEGSHPFKVNTPGWIRGIGWISPSDSFFEDFLGDVPAACKDAQDEYIFSCDGESYADATPITDDSEARDCTFAHRAALREGVECVNEGDYPIYELPSYAGTSFRREIVVELVELSHRIGMIDNTAGHTYLASTVGCSRLA